MVLQDLFLTLFLIDEAIGEKLDEARRFTLTTLNFLGM